MTSHKNQPEVAAFVCSHVLKNSRAILLIARERGDWMFLCGAEHGPEEEYGVVGVGHLVDRDPSICQVMDLQDNFEAEREDVGSPWIRSRLDGNGH